MKTSVKNTSRGKIEYSIYGKGTPVLFIHGGHSNSQETLTHKGFNPEKFLIITPSRPGYGQTPLLNNTSPLEAATLIIALLDELNIPSVTLIGISAGGLTAIELAAGFPARINKLVLASAVTKKWLWATDENYIKGKRIFNPAVEKYSWFLFRLFYRLFPGLMARTLWRELSSAANEPITKAEISELKEMVMQQRSYAGFVNDLDQDINPEILNRITCPTLIVHSRNDKSVPLAHAEHAQRNIRKATLHLVNNKWGHLIWLGPESDEIVKQLVGFCESAP